MNFKYSTLKSFEWLGNGISEIISPLVAYIIKIENLPTFSGEKTDMLGFSVVGLAKNTLWVVNLSSF